MTLTGHFAQSGTITYRMMLPAQIGKQMHKGTPPLKRFVLIKTQQLYRVEIPKL